MGACKQFAILCGAWGCLISVANAGAPVPATVYSFCADVACVNGAFVYPYGASALVQGTDGGLYGTTYAGGAYGYGSVYGISPSGAPITLYSFCATSGCPDGSNPYFGLTLAPNGDLYGVTTYGGEPGSYGTIFKFTPSSGVLTTLHLFCSRRVGPCEDGFWPFAGLTLGSNGDLYGTTARGGWNDRGTIFKITPSGTFKTLYAFSGIADGYTPQAPLVQFSDGDLYGTTTGSGENGPGTIFKFALGGGGLTTLYTFTRPDYCCSQVGLLPASNGNLYGTSKFGGSSGMGAIYEVTPAGQPTTLYSFSGPDGSNPNSALIQATDGNLYGTTEVGGTSGAGTIFKMTLDGELTTLYEFGSSYAGMTNSIYAGLFQATDGNLYGTTEIGGTANDGTVFRLATGLGQFVETLPISGKPGDTVTILGSLIGQASSVSFNGTPAPFTIISGTEISTTVPAGATTGTLTVVTPGGALKSNVRFKVIPTPSFDGTYLTIPALAIGNGIFTNVVVTPLSIVDVQMGNPNGTVNTYDPTTNQLTLPFVTYAGDIYTNVTATVRSLVSVGTVSGMDVYSFANSELNIPVVDVIGNPAYFTDVVVTVQSVQSLGGGMPENVEDVYNPATRQLTIAAVQVGGMVYTNAIVTVGDIVHP